MSNYKNKKRPTGSQSEVPGISTSPTGVSVRGYQHYSLRKDGSYSFGKNAERKQKYSNLFNTLRELSRTCKTINDIGCSNGLVCFLALKAGFQQAFGYDHDAECVNLIKRAASHMNLNVISNVYGFTCS